MNARTLPPWAEELRATYLRGECSMFVLHGNVYDLILHEGQLTPLIDFLAKELLAKKNTICHYNPSLGAKFLKKTDPIEKIEDLAGLRETDAALVRLERLLRTKDGFGLIVDYAEMIAPTGETSFLTDADRRAVVTLHRWSLDRSFERSDNVVILVTEQLLELAPKIVGNPKISAIRVPLPDASERTAVVRLLEPEANAREIERLAALSAGLKNVQIQGILAPGNDAAEDRDSRYEMIRELLGNAPDAKERAKTLTRVTAGMTRDQVKSHLASEGLDVDSYGKTDGKYDDVFRLMEQRKRAILEKECFGLIRFVNPSHDFSAVGGIDGVKDELMKIAHNIRAGEARRVPMGLLFTGPMGTGKTFVAEAFAKSSGLTAIKLENFRSKWVGSTEGNLEKILSVIEAIGNILVIVDEVDRAFGNSGDEDGGTSSRVIARLKEFMSNTANRGRVLFVLMSNRPDKLDLDIKRAGRIDRKIPFFYAETPEEIEPIVLAQVRRHRIACRLEFPRDRAAVSAHLVGYSNADVEAIMLAANDRAESGDVSVEQITRAIADYLPSRDTTTLEYMELLAVSECSSRSMLPKRYANIGATELQARLRELRGRV